jgi:signal transduction histidine kinase
MNAASLVVLLTAAPAFSATIEKLPEAPVEAGAARLESGPKSIELATLPVQVEVSVRGPLANGTLTGMPVLSIAEAHTIIEGRKASAILPPPRTPAVPTVVGPGTHAAFSAKLAANMAQAAEGVENLQNLPAAGGADAQAIGRQLQATLEGAPVPRTTQEFLDHFDAWTIGQVYEPPTTTDPELTALGMRLKKKADQLNAQHQERIDLNANLMAGMAHDSRTPLSAAVTASGMLDMIVADGKLTALAKDHPKLEKLGRLTGLISRSLNRIGTTISNYADLGALAAGEISREAVAAGEIVKDQAAALADEAEKKKIELVLDVDDTGLIVSADARALTQVLNNLIANAVKYTPAGGKVVVSAHRHANFVRFTVRDSGIGISSEDQGKVFAGHRTEEGRKIASGTGRGLRLVKQLLDSHGTRVELDSAPGLGSKFSFVLSVPES